MLQVVKAPFTQHWSIHAFVRAGDAMKQLPLAFVLMSGKRKADYKAVRRAVRKLLLARLEDKPLKVCIILSLY